MTAQHRLISDYTKLTKADARAYIMHDLSDDQ